MMTAAITARFTPVTYGRISPFHDIAKIQFARSSAGVVNRVPIAQVANLPELVQTLRTRGIRIVGASEKADKLLTDCNFRDATAIVIGNEGSGIGPELLARCDALARIPIDGAVGSLNAAAAAAVFFFEVRRQRGGA